ncbi:hypothetical protein C8R45DRAFT_1100763 [Mycena sanguinolenta]|nr:hypothetical protein C8R45DRAFT_1100763 [Mycena sanguinolenta]
MRDASIRAVYEVKLDIQISLPILLTLTFDTHEVSGLSNDCVKWPLKCGTAGWCEVRSGSSGVLDGRAREEHNRPASTKCAALRKLQNAGRGGGRQLPTTCEVLAFCGQLQSALAQRITTVHGINVPATHLDASTRFAPLASRPRGGSFDRRRVHRAGTRVVPSVRTREEKGDLRRKLEMKMTYICVHCSATPARWDEVLVRVHKSDSTSQHASSGTSSDPALDVSCRRVSPSAYWPRGSSSCTRPSMSVGRDVDAVVQSGIHSTFTSVEGLARYG